MTEPISLSELLVGGTIFTALAIFVLTITIKKFIISSFDETIEEYKGLIQKNIAKEIEPFKALLSKENIAFQINSTEYIRKRFERIDKLYSYWYELHMTVFSFPLINQLATDEKRKEIQTKYIAVYETLILTSVYINSDLVDKLRKLLEPYAKFSSKFFQLSLIQKPETINVEKEKELETALTDLQDGMDKTFRGVESELRIYLSSFAS